MNHLHDCDVRRRIFKSPISHLQIAGMFILALMACAERASPGSLAQDKLENARPVMVNPLDSMRAEMWETPLAYTTLGLDSLQIGAGESLFARFLPDGSLVVANGPTIVVLNPDGSLDRTLARAGDGPGEFRMVLALGVGSDSSIFASDHLSGRFTAVSAGGELRRYIPRLRPFSGGREVTPFVSLPGGKVIGAPWQGQPSRYPPPEAVEGSVTRDEVPIAVFDSTGEIAETLLVLAGLERSAGFVTPFPKSAVYAGRGQFWIAGVSDSLDLTLFDGTRPVMRMAAPHSRSFPTREQARLQEAAVKDEFGPAIGAAILERQREMSVDHTLPDIGGAAISASGDIWVGAYSAPGSVNRPWYVFDTAGNCLGRLLLPAFGDPLVPARTELLDVGAGRLALLREQPDGEVYIEVRNVMQ